MMSVFKNLAGTISCAFRIGLKGPLISSGSTDPDTASAATIAATKQPTQFGDLYVQTGDHPKVLIYRSDGWIDISEANFVPKVITSSSYICNGAETFLAINSPISASITLPVGISGSRITIKDISGSLSSDRIISTFASSSQTIDGNAKSVMTTAYGTLRLVYVNEWHIV